MPIRDRLLIIAVIALHTVLVLAYTLPDKFVPKALNAMSIGYMRPFFHQQWRLFAPDPPLCSCEIEVELNSGHVLPFDHGTDNYLCDRMAQTIARLVQFEVAKGDTIPRPELVQAMKAITRDLGQGAGGTHFALREECVVDRHLPRERELRITRLDTGVRK